VRAAKPKAPLNLPTGTVQISGAAEWFALALCVRGADLNPDHVTTTLGVAPTSILRKGEPINSRNPHSRPSASARWELALDPNDTDEWDVEEAANLLLSRVPATPSAWRLLPAECEVYLDVALSLTAMSSGFSFSPSLMARLGERNIEARFDVYEKSVPK
jgi:hypothetical protein